MTRYAAAVAAERTSVARAFALVLSLAVIVAIGCRRQQGEAAKPVLPHVPDPPAGTLPVAVIQVRGKGPIRIELLEHKAPKTVANFEKLAESGFYDGTTFHRVVPGFMIQGGDPNSRDRDPRNDGQGGPGYAIPDEFNDESHLRGVVSMANIGRPDTGGSQFFILVGDAPYLDGHHTTFGRVLSGMEVADAIVAVPRDEYGRYGPRDRPLDDVVIESVKIERPAARSAPGG
jgi:cyclophilin family peptidyl-prolyl cis-trans isomerase